MMMKRGVKCTDFDVSVGDLMVSASDSESKVHHVDNNSLHHIRNQHHLDHTGVKGDTAF